MLLFSLFSLSVSLRWAERLSCRGIDDINLRKRKATSALALIMGTPMVAVSFDA
jgi:hypothetical protein